MDIKQVQYDTLSHWALERGCTFLAPVDADKQGPAVNIENNVTSLPQALQTLTAWYSKADEEVSVFWTV